MAFPTILVDSATGSDTAASGAGPSTALTGTAASTDAAGTLVTLDGSPDLSALATDGSAAIYLANSTAGARNFAKITAKDDSAKTVTVAEAFAASLSGKSWAIGGKRATVFGGTSLRLTNNNSAAGDVMPGWTIQVDSTSGYTETFAGPMTLYRSGNTTDGPITLQGADNYSVMPVFSDSSNTGAAINLIGNNADGMWQFRNFKLQNTNATKTNSVGFGKYQIRNYLFENLVIGDDTNYFAYGAMSGAGAEFHNLRFIRCTFNKSATGNNLLIFNGENSGSETMQFINCMFKNSGLNGFLWDEQNFPFTGGFYNCQFLNNANYGIRDRHENFSGPDFIFNCTFEDNTAGGLEIYRNRETQIVNCIFSNNGGYGINITGTASGPFALATGLRLRNCAFYNNTSGNYPTGYSVISFGEVSGVDPQYVSSTDLTPTNTAIQVGLQSPP